MGLLDITKKLTKKKKIVINQEIDFMVFYNVLNSMLQKSILKYLRVSIILF